MGQVQVQVQAPQEREPKRMKLESQEEGNTLGSQVDKPIQTKVENMTNMMTLVKGEEGGSSPRTGHYTGHNRGEDVIAEDRAAKAKSDFQLRSMQAQLGIYPQN